MTSSQQPPMMGWHREPMLPHELPAQILRLYGPEALVAWDRDLDPRSDLDGSEFIWFDPNAPACFILSGLVTLPTIGCLMTADPARLALRARHGFYDGEIRIVHGCRIILSPDPTDPLGMYWIDSVLCQDVARRPYEAY